MMEDLEARFQPKGYGTLGHIVEHVLLDMDELVPYGRTRIIEAVEMAAGHFWEVLFDHGIDAMAHDLCDGFDRADLESGTDAY